jgi:hypothetical protein
MAAYYTASLQPQLEASLPPTPSKQEKVTTAIYKGPLKVMGGVGRPDSQHIPTFSQPTPSQPFLKQGQGVQYAPNEKGAIQIDLQNDLNVTPIGALSRNSGIIKCPLCKQCDPTNTRKVIGSGNQLVYHPLSLLGM